MGARAKQDLLAVDHLLLDLGRARRVRSSDWGHLQEIASDLPHSDRRDASCVEGAAGVLEDPLGGRVSTLT